MTTDIDKPLRMDWLVQDNERIQAGMNLARMTLSPGCLSEAHRHRTELVPENRTVG